MTDIDLTPMNEATARALFAEQYAERFIQTVSGYSPEQYAKLRFATRLAAAKAWDDNLIPHEKMIEYRELALAATLTTWKDVARQAYAEGYTDGVHDEKQAEAMEAGYQAARVNPYEEI